MKFPTLCCLYGGLFLFLNCVASSALAQDDEHPSFHSILVAAFESANESKITAVKSKKTKAKQTAVVNFDIYRDRNPLPVDPRKPCNECIARQDSCKKCKSCELTGFQGRPYRDREPGGCRCGKCSSKKKARPNFSVYWPSPLNAASEQHHPARAARRSENLDRFRINNLFDGFAGFELLPYQRRDNGHCGPNRDRYGCLGESRYLQSRVDGVGLRLPGQPYPRGGIEFPGIEFP